MELRQKRTEAGISLQEILPDCQIFGADSIQVSSCSHDWNRLQPGDLYVACAGMEKDGHDHIPMAIKKGAAAILSERFVVADVPVCLVDDTREAYGQICQYLVGTPKDKLKLIGVTGTDGKSITCQLIRSILHQSGIRCGMISSLAYCDGFVYSKTSGTTPSPPQMAEYLGELVANECEAAVIETSSEGIAERRLSGLEFDACVYTNVKKDHLDSHGTLKNYRKIKTRLLDRLKPDGFAVLNADDKFLGKWIDNIHCPTLTYGTRNHAEIQAERIEQTVFGQTFLIFAGNESIPVKTPVVGDFFIRHCLAAVTVGLAFGLELEDVVRGIESVERIPGRMERLSSQHPSSIFIDAAKTPSQLHGMLRTLNSLPQEGKTWCIFGGASGVSKEQLAGLGTVAERHADHTIISGVDVHNESALEIAHEILDGYEDVAKAHIIPNRAAAIEHVLDNAAAGDKILIAGLGDQPTQFGYYAELSMSDRELCELWQEDRLALGELTRNYEDDLPISYSIDDYR